jgi:hypothetical protein
VITLATLARSRYRLACLILLALLVAPLGALAAPGQPQAGQHSVFLPLARNAGTPPPPPPARVGGLFLTRDIKNSSADIAVDPAGGLHVAYAGYVGYGTLSPGYYGYCPATADCAKRASWSIVAFGAGQDYIVKVEIELTKAGQPRLLLYNESNGRLYTYAACDAGCTSRGNWSTADVTRVQSHVDLDTFDYSYHTFELDPQGRPRFIYEDHYGSIHNGLYYVYCDATCTNSDNWFEQNISAGPDYDGDRVQTPDLKFTQQGQPRILTQLYSVDENYPAGLYYISCDQSCDQAGSWERTRLADRGNGHASWTLALDAQDRPRAAFYQAELPSGGNRLNYMWCDAGCTSAASWTMAPVGLDQGNGQSPAIALDGQGRPRIAFAIKEDQGIGYLWCDSQCGAAAQWHGRLAESLETLNQDFPRPAPINCDVSTWLGARPQLALDAAGNPRIGYDGEFLVGNNFMCKPTIEFRAARFVFFAKP